jgi:hypothetical protein
LRRFGPSDFQRVPWPKPEQPDGDAGLQTVWNLRLSRTADDEDAALLSDSRGMRDPGLEFEVLVDTSGDLKVSFGWHHYDGDAFMRSVAAVRLAVAILPVTEVQGRAVSEWAVFSDR